MPSKLKRITKPKHLKELIEYCKKTGYASFDFETNALPINDPLFLPTVVGVSFQIGSSYTLPLAHFESPFRKNSKWLRMLKKLGKEVFENPEIVKISWNAKFEYKILKLYDIDIKGVYLDGMLAKYLLDEERPMGLKPNVDKYIPEYAGYSEDYEGAHLPWAEKPLKGLSKYCGLDCDLTFRLTIYFEAQLIKLGLYPLFRNMLMMGVRVLGDSEFTGIPIDVPYLDDLVIKYENNIVALEDKLKNNKKVKKFEDWMIGQRVNKLIDKCNEEINDLLDEIEALEKKYKKNKDNKVFNTISRKKKLIEAREDKVDRYIMRQMSTKKELDCLEPVNFKSPNQLVDLFFNSPKGFKFDVVKYTTDKATKKETERPSTDESVLEELSKEDKTGFCNTLLEYRGITKLYSTYVKGIREKVVEGRIHGRFKLEGTVTGRLSSTDPNLQNIPREATAADIKPMFVPPPGYVLLQADYSQAELRVMAAMAGEETMVKWFKEGKDIHITTALKMYKQEDRYDEVVEILKKEDDNDPRFLEWTKKRKYAKTINFGIIYGQGPPKLAEALGWTVEEAKKFLKDYFKLFPKIKKFIEKQHRKAHEYGYVENVFGRKRRLTKIDSLQKYEVAEAERQSVNAPIQGAASDYTLFSSIIIWEQSKAGLIPIDLPQCYTVHDSLGYFVKPELLGEIVPKIEAICANPQTMDWFGFQIDEVVMKVDFEVSHISWGHLRTYHPETDYKQLMLSHSRKTIY